MPVLSIHSFNARLYPQLERLIAELPTLNGNIHGFIAI